MKKTLIHLASVSDRFPTLPHPQLQLLLLCFHISLAFEIQMKCILRPQGEAGASFQSAPLKNWRQIERIKWKRNLFLLLSFFFFGGKCQKNIANKSMQFSIKFVFPSGNRKCTKPKWKCSLKRLQNLLSEPWVKCLAVLSSFDFATCSAIAIHCHFSASTAPVPSPFQSTKMTNFEFIKITWNATLRAFWLRFSAEFTITDSDKDFPRRQARKSLPDFPSPSLSVLLPCPDEYFM